MKLGDKVHFVLRGVFFRHFRQVISAENTYIHTHVYNTVMLYYIHCISVQFSLVTQSCLTLCDPWTSARLASLSITNSQSLLKLMSTESVMPSNHFILKSVILHYSSKASIFQFSTFFIVQLSHPIYDYWKKHSLYVYNIYYFIQYHIIYICVCVCVCVCVCIHIYIGVCVYIYICTPKRYSFHYRDWNAKVGSQETPGVIGKFGLGVQNQAGQRVIEFCQENALVIANTLFQQHNTILYTWTSPDGQHRNQTDYIFAAKDGEALYSQQKQDQELTVAQIMNSLLANSDLN